MDYDVLILGGGIIGCSVAYELSKYNLNIAVIEKDYDIADDISLINTEIVYDGSECEDKFLSTIEHKGNSMLDEITSKFNVPFKRAGSIKIANENKAIDIIEGIYKRAKERNINDIYLMDKNDVKDIEPNISLDFKKAVYSPNIGVIAPYDLAIAYAEVAFDNGATFRLEEEVTDIKKIVNGFKVTTNKNKFSCRVVVNTIPGEYNTLDSDIKSNGQKESDVHYLILNDRSKPFSNSIITAVSDEGDMIKYIPAAGNESLIAINKKGTLKFNDAVRLAKKVVPSIDKDAVNSIYHEKSRNNLVIIDDNENYNGYIRVCGDHYATVTMTPAIASMICETIVSNLTCSKNKNFIDKRREFYKFKDMSDEERNEVIAIDKKYGKITCLCNLISEGEIVDSIRRPLGARTVEGVKRRTGATFGSCHGAHCISKIIYILARELNKKPTDIVEDSKNSKVLASRIKEF